MRIFIDTNILFSAILTPNSTPYKAYFKAVTLPNKGIISDQNITELRRVFNRKFPSKLQTLESFLAVALLSLEVVHVPQDTISDETKIRDIADRPILRAAIAADADILLTGDKDFLESGIKHPMILTATEFVQK